MLTEKYIDLHCHSTFSDGTFTPEELVLLAKKQNLCALALTDHDTIDGLTYFHEAGQKHNLKTISGIEFGALYEYHSKHTEIHIVGLNFDETSPILLNKMDFLHNSREKRNVEMVTKLCNLGFPMTLEEVTQNAGGDIITRAHFANILLQKSYIQTKNEAFQKYLSPGLPAYVEREFLTPSQCIETIHSAGGVAILAHPTLYSMDFGQIKDLCRTLKSQGLDGVEVQYSTYTTRQAKILRKIARELDLAFSGGSDFHGKNKPNIQLGIGKGNLKIPYSYFKELQNRK